MTVAAGHLRRRGRLRARLVATLLACEALYVLGLAAVLLPYDATGAAFDGRPRHPLTTVAAGAVAIGVAVGLLRLAWTTGRGRGTPLDAALGWLAAAAHGAVGITAVAGLVAMR